MGYHLLSSQKLGYVGFGRAGRKRGPYRLFYDTFTGADGTLLTAHTPDVDTVGGGWLSSQSLQIQSNKARAGGGTAFAHANVSDADVTASVVVTMASINSGSLAGLLTRTVNGLAFWQFVIYQTGAIGTRGLYIYETNTLRAFTAYAYQTSTPYTLTATLSGSSLSCTDGTNTVNYTSSSMQSNTAHGIRAVDVGHTFDNFEVLP